MLFSSFTLCIDFLVIGSFKWNCGACRSWCSGIASEMAKENIHESWKLSWCSETPCEPNGGASISGSSISCLIFFFSPKMLVSLWTTFSVLLHTLFSLEVVFISEKSVPCVSIRREIFFFNKIAFIFSKLCAYLLCCIGISETQAHSAAHDDNQTFGLLP